jgi:hypothetical protein
VVKLRVGVHDNGPAFLDSTHIGKGARSYEVTLPPGTEPVLVPGNCQAIAGRPAPAAYRCDTDQLFIPAHEESTVIFRVRITRVIAGASGSVTIVDQPADLDPGNDTAQVLLNPTGNGLPITGAQTAVIAAVGALLLVAGATLYLLARVLARVTSARRRTSAGRR